MGCRKYRARLEDRVSGGASRDRLDTALDEHLRTCGRCREALDAALLASDLAHGVEFAPEIPSERFVARVMAAIRDEEARLWLPNAIWRPLEVLASRFALVAAVVLLALSVYLAEFASVRGMTFANPQTEVGAAMPEPPAQPANADEVLMSLVDKDNGF